MSGAPDPGKARPNDAPDARKTEPSGAATLSERAGLCAGCRHRRTVRSDRASVFLLCLLSRRDPRFPRYPRLPVLSCAGYEPAADSAGR